MRNAKLLVINTAVLTLGGFLMRTISVSFNVYLTNKIGASGIGLLQLIMAVYSLAVTFAGAGIKLGATRLVTEALSSKNGVINDIIKMCIRYALTVGSTVCLIMYIFSNLISKRYIFDEHAARPLKILALSLPAISVSAALNGFFTARKTMVKYSVVQLAEQFAKIIVTVIALMFFGDTGVEHACSAVAVGTTLSEIISAISAYVLYRIDKINKYCAPKNASSLGKLLHICVPDAIGSGFRSILLTVEHLLIPQGFKKSGQSVEYSMSTYGTIHGIALPIILYPSAVLTSLSSLLIPELARYKLSGDNYKISFISSTAIKTTLIFSIAAAAFMFFFSDTISIAVFGNYEADFYIKLLSVLIPIMYCDMITDGLLKGLDQQAASMRYNIFDSSICVILVYFLLPKFAVGGYIFILFISEIINFALSINKLSKITMLQINTVNDIIKPLLCSCGCCAAMHIVVSYFEILSSSPKILLTILILICSLFYFLGIICLNSISKTELKIYSSMFKSKGYA